MKKEDLIGKKVKGFKFKTSTHKKLPYNPLRMNTFIGQIGEIISYHEDNDSFKVFFKNKNEKWNYPASLIEEHLVEENKKETNNKKPRGMCATKKHVEKVKKEIIETMKKEFEEIQKKQDESWNKRLDEIRKSLFEKTQEYMESEEFCKNLSDLQEKELEKYTNIRESLNQVRRAFKEAILQSQKKPPFKVEKGNWIYLESTNGNISIVYATSNGNNERFYGYGYSFSTSKWQNLKPGDIEAWPVDNAKRNATEQEVVDMIINEVKRRGYERGVKVKCLFPEGLGDLKKINSNPNYFLEYLMEEGEVILNESPININLMRNGEWAEIVEEESVVPSECDWEQKTGLRYMIFHAGEVDEGCPEHSFANKYHTKERAEQMKAFQDLVRLADETNRRDGFDISDRGICISEINNYKATSKKVLLKFRNINIAIEFLNKHRSKIEQATEGGLL